MNTIEKKPAPRTVELGAPPPDSAEAVELEPTAHLGNRHHAHVTLQLHDGTVLIGNLSVGASRLSDFMNNEKAFVVLVDDHGKAHILNKKYIVKVTER